MFRGWGIMYPDRLRTVAGLRRRSDCGAMLRVRAACVSFPPSMLRTHIDAASRTSAYRMKMENFRLYGSSAPIYVSARGVQSLNTPALLSSDGAAG